LNEEYAALAKQRYGWLSFALRLMRSRIFLHGRD